jgi:heme-degrading monooxygenase HmoA
MSEPLYLAVWEFQVRPESREEFELNYGPDGLWSKLFRHSAAYLGSELLRDVARAGRYLTIDRWTSREAFRQFKRQYAAEYAALDKGFERLTESEAFIGDFESGAS